MVKIKNFIGRTNDKNVTKKESTTEKNINKQTNKQRNKETNKQRNKQRNKLVYLQFFLLITLLTTIVKSKNIAICITGQTGRMLPHLLIPFFEDNKEHNLTLFYVLQKSKDPSSIVYNTAKDQIFEPSKYAFMSDDEIFENLKNLYKSYKNVKIASFQTRFPSSEDDFKRELGVQKLDRFRQFEKVQPTILNMYTNHVMCVTMAEKERENNDYLITMREDIIFLGAFKLSNLLPKLDHGRCDFLAKDCLAHGGVNMRVNVMKFDFGVRYVKNRLNFYRSLYNGAIFRNNTFDSHLAIEGYEGKVGYTVKNPEAFDKLHLQCLGSKICPLSINEMPSTGARHTKNEKYCISDIEYQGCIPDNTEIIKCK